MHFFFFQIILVIVSRGRQVNVDSRRMLCICIIDIEKLQVCSLFLWLPNIPILAENKMMHILFRYT